MREKENCLKGKVNLYIMELDEANPRCIMK